MVLDCHSSKKRGGGVRSKEELKGVSKKSKKTFKAKGSDKKSSSALKRKSFKGKIKNVKNVASVRTSKGEVSSKRNGGQEPQVTDSASKKRKVGTTTTGPVIY